MPAEEAPSTPEPAAEAIVHNAIAEPEHDTSGDFREPHPEEPAETAPPEESSESIAAEAEPLTEPAGEALPETAPGGEPEPAAEPERRPERPAYSESRRPEHKPWSKPADFRPAEPSAITQAVAHATEIAESLKHTIDQLEEILELVELAERQKLADEREIDELRRALRRIQPPRHQQLSRGPRHDEPHRGPREHGQRHEEQRSPRPEPPDQPPHSEESRPPESGEGPEPF